MLSHDPPYCDNRQQPLKGLTASFLLFFEFQLIYFSHQRCERRAQGEKKSYPIFTSVM